VSIAANVPTHDGKARWDIRRGALNGFDMAPNLLFELAKA
jgi:hypothetical protein